MTKVVQDKSLHSIRPVLGKVDAHIFLDDAKSSLEKYPGVFKNLIATLEIFHKNRDVKAFLTRISRLLFPFPEILERINCWLPVGSCLTYDGEKSILIRHGSFTRSILSQPRRSSRRKS